MRGVREVLEDHLRLRRDGDLEADLARNYAPDVVAIVATGVHHGLDGMRELAAELERELPNADFKYLTLQVAGEVGFLAWRGKSRRAPRHVMDGADSYVVRGGRIVAQTIAYRVQPAED